MGLGSQKKAFGIPLGDELYVENCTFFDSHPFGRSNVLHYGLFPPTLLYYSSFLILIQHFFSLIMTEKFRPRWTAPRLFPESTCKEYGLKTGMHVPGHRVVDGAWTFF